jgi:acetylornithine deacetylase/succinyl-diaminopimelate desuccinylase-like protein
VSVGDPRYESFWLGENHPFVDEFAGAYRDVIGKEPDLAFGRGVSDANIFSGRADIPTILFGPGGANMHAGDEWVDLDQLHLAERLYTEFARRFLKSTHERLLL